MFIPLDEISSLVVNEALSGWEMRHYLALIRRKGAGIDVVFDVSPGTDIASQSSRPADDGRAFASLGHC